MGLIFTNHCENQHVGSGCSQPRGQWLHEMQGGRERTGTLQPERAEFEPQATLCWLHPSGGVSARRWAAVLLLSWQVVVGAGNSRCSIKDSCYYLEWLLSIVSSFCSFRLAV